jgi:hypothetical protein
VRGRGVPPADARRRIADHLCAEPLIGGMMVMALPPLFTTASSSARSSGYRVGSPHGLCERAHRALRRGVLAGLLRRDRVLGMPFFFNPMLT